MTFLALVGLLALAVYVYRNRQIRTRRIRARLLRYARSEALLITRPVLRAPRGTLFNRIIEATRTRLGMAQINLRPQEYLGIIAAASVSAFLVGAAVRGIGGGLVLGAGAAAVVYLWPERLASRRKQQFIQQLPAALSAMAGALRAGQSVHQAVRIVGEEFPEPVGPEFGRVVQAMQLGVPLRESVAGMRKRTDVEDISYLESAIALHQQTGADLGYLLDRLTDALRTRMEAEAELRALTSQARLSGRVLIWMPFVLGGFMYLIDKDYGKTMFGTGPGRMVLVLSVFLLLLGRYLIRRITEVF